MMMQKAKKVPMRKCVSCNERKEKKELIRVVVSDGLTVIDKTQKQNGRGAYLCKDEIKTTAELYELLIKELQN